MISGIFGLPAAGKTTVLAMLANRALQGKPLHIGLLWRTTLQHHRQYGKVYTNFPMHGCYRLNFDDLGKFQFENCLILIDEVMLLCDSRNWKSFTDDLKFFFSHHRKFGVDIVYCSQSYTDCDLKIRNLTEQLFHMERFGQWTVVTPIYKTFDVYGGKINEIYEKSAPVCRSFVYRPKYYKLFDTSFSSRGQLPTKHYSMW